MLSRAKTLNSLCCTGQAQGLQGNSPQLVWAADLPPGLLRVMSNLRWHANMAACHGARLHMDSAMGPEALLALAVIADEIMKEQLASSPSV